MWDNLKKILEAGVAQVNPFDNGQTWQSVMRRPTAPPQPRPQPQPQQQPAIFKAFNDVGNVFRPQTFRPPSQPTAAQPAYQKMLADVSRSGPGFFEGATQNFAGGLGREAANIGGFIEKYNPLGIAANAATGGDFYNKSDAKIAEVKRRFFPEQGTPNSLSTRPNDAPGIQAGKIAGSTLKTAAEQGALMAGSAGVGNVAGGAAGAAAANAGRGALTTALIRNAASGAAGGGAFALGSDAAAGKSGGETLKDVAGWTVAGGVGGGLVPMVPNVGKIPVVRAIPRALTGSAIGAATAPLTGFTPEQGAMFGLLGGTVKPYKGQELADAAQKATSRVGGELAIRGSNTRGEVPTKDLISREGYHQSTVDAYKAKIQKNGPESIKPIKVEPDVNGQARIMDGNNRFEAFRELGYDRVPVQGPKNPGGYMKLPGGGKKLPDQAAQDLINKAKAEKELAKGRAIISGDKKIGNQYEIAVGNGLQKKGYNVEFVGQEKGFQDYGRDLVAKNPKETLVIQNKVRGQKTTLHDRPVQYHYQVVEEYKRQHPNENVKGVVYSTRKLDKDAAEFAKNNGIEVRFVDANGKQFAKPIKPNAAPMTLQEAIPLSTKDQTRILDTIPVQNREQFLKDMKNPDSAISKSLRMVPRDKQYGMAEDFYKATNPAGTYELTSLKGMSRQLARANGEADVQNVIQKAIQRNEQGGGSNPLFDQLSKRVLGDKKFATQLAKEQSQYKIRRMIDPQGQVYNPVVAGTQDRGFIKTVQNSPQTTKGVAQNIEAKYNPQTNLETLETAGKDIGVNMKGNITNHQLFNRAVADARISDDLSTATQAKSLRLVKVLQSQGREQDAIDIVEKMSERATKNGQATQILAAYNALSPDGILAYAQRTIDRAKSLNPAKYGELKITPEQSKALKEMAYKLQGLKGDDKLIAQKKLLDEIGRMVPTPMLEKAVTIWKAGLLTGIKGGVSGNTVGNSANILLKKLSDAPSSAFDRVIGLATGERSKTFTLKGLLSGGTEGVGMGYKAMKTGVGAEELANKLDYKKAYFGKGPLGQAAQKYTDFVFGFYSAADKPFKMAALKNSLYDLASVEAKNKGLSGAQRAKFIKYTVDNPDDKMLQTATNDALDAVFQDKTGMGAALRGFKQGLAQKSPQLGAVGEVVMPFTGVPSSVATKLYKYSPAAPVVEIYRAIRTAAKGNFDQAAQRNLAEALGKGVTGTGMLWLGAQLWNNDMLTLGMPTDPVERKLWDLQGKQPWSIRIGDKWLSLNYTGPVLAVLGAGGTLAQSMKSGNNPIVAAGSAVAGTAKAVLESSPLRGLQSALDVISQPDRYGERYMEQLGGSIVPTIVGDVANATDKLQREVMGVPEAIKYKIPGLRETLNPKVNPFGEPKDNQLYGVQALIDPFRMSDARNTPLTGALQELYNNGQGTMPSDIQKDFYGGDHKLTEKEIYDITTTINPEIKAAWEKTISDPAWPSLTPEQKKDALDNAAKDIRGARKFELGTGAGYLDPKEAMKKLDPRQRRVLRGAPTDYVGLASTGEATNPKQAYEDALATYNDRKSAGEITNIEDLKEQKKLATLKAKAGFSQDVVDLYSLSKNEILDYTANNPDGQNLLNQVIALDDALRANGGSSKFRDSKGNLNLAKSSKGGKKGGKGRKTASRKFKPKVGVSYAKLNSLLKGARVGKA